MLPQMLPPEVLAFANAAVAGDAAALAAYHAFLQSYVFGGEGHLGRTLGIEVLLVARDAVTMRLPWRPEVRRMGDIFHGGAIMALGDHVAGCLFNTDPRVAVSGSTGLTTDFNVSFLRAAELGEAVVGVGSVLRRGRHLTFMQIDVHGEHTSRTIATCRTTYLTVPLERVGT
jgi:1,4-dihydroxy-2-naphthoyl-CoA hydrolase